MEKVVHAASYALRRHAVMTHQRQRAGALAQCSALDASATTAHIVQQCSKHLLSCITGKQQQQQHHAQLTNSHDVSFWLWRQVIQLNAHGCLIAQMCMWQGWSKLKVQETGYVHLSC